MSRHRFFCITFHFFVQIFQKSLEFWAVFCFFITVLLFYCFRKFLLQLLHILISLSFCARIRFVFKHCLYLFLYFNLLLYGFWLLNNLLIIFYLYFLVKLIWFHFKVSSNVFGHLYNQFNILVPSFWYYIIIFPLIIKLCLHFQFFKLLSLHTPIAWHLERTKWWSVVQTLI